MSFSHISIVDKQPVPSVVEKVSRQINDLLFEDDKKSLLQQAAIASNKNSEADVSLALKKCRRVHCVEKKYEPRARDFDV